MHLMILLRDEMMMRMRATLALFVNNNNNQLGPTTIVVVLVSLILQLVVLVSLILTVDSWCLKTVEQACFSRKYGSSMTMSKTLTEQYSKNKILIMVA